MSDYFEKLGNLLNEALEKGEIPAEKQENLEESENFCNKTEENIRKNNINKDNTEPKQKVKTEKKHFFKNSRPEQTGFVYKMHKYTENIQFPPEITQALITLDIVYPCKWNDINKKYHQLLKQMHPDTNKNFQSSKSVINNRQISDIQDAYNTLKVYFNK